MAWIFGSFLVAPSALTSCHVGISKQGDDNVQGSQIEQVCIRKETT